MWNPHCGWHKVGKMKVKCLLGKFWIFKTCIIANRPKKLTFRYWFSINASQNYTRCNALNIPVWRKDKKGRSQRRGEEEMQIQRNLFSVWAPLLSYQVGQSVHWEDQVLIVMTMIKAPKFRRQWWWQRFDNDDDETILLLCSICKSYALHSYGHHNNNDSNDDDDEATKRVLCSYSVTITTTTMTMKKNKELGFLFLCSISYALHGLWWNIQPTM